MSLLVSDRPISNSLMDHDSIRRHICVTRGFLQSLEATSPASPRELHILPEDQTELGAALLDVVTIEDEDEVANWALQVRIWSIGSSKYIAIHLLQTK